MMRTKRQSAFTLIEVIVATAIASFVVAAAVTSFNVQSDTYTIVDQTTEAQQNMRAIADLMERDIRATGYFVPEAAAICGVDETTLSDTLVVTDTNAINPEDAAGLFQEFQPMFVTVDAGAPTSGSNQTVGIDRLILETGVPPPANPAAYDNDGNGTPESDFLQTNGGVIIANATNPTAGVACGTITQVTGGINPQLRVDFLTGTALTVNPGETLIAVPAIVYAIDTTGPTSVLERNGVRLAEDVEDFQVAWIFDLDRDGFSTPAENLGSGPFPVNYDPSIRDHRLLREVRLNLVVRTKNQNIAIRDNQRAIQSQPQGLENRLLVTPPTDGFRRRVHTTTIRARNVGFRGRLGEKEAQL